MANYDVLKQLVGNGSHLILCSGISYDALNEIAEIASRTGARLTVTTSMSYDVLTQLSQKYGSAITFIDGLGKFEKDK